MLQQVEEIIQTLSLIHSSIDLNADFKREIFAVLEIAQGVNEQMDDCTTEEALASLQRHLSSEHTWKQAEAVLGVVFQVSENTATACQIAQQISSGIREGCEYTVKACTKTVQSVPDEFSAIANSAEFLRKVLPTETKAWIHSLESVQARQTANARLSRSIKVNFSQLSIILSAYSEAKQHLTSKVSALRKEMFELENEKAAQLAEFNKLLDEIHQSEETLFKLKNSTNVKAEETFNSNGAEESIEGSPGKSFTSRFPKNVFFKKDRTQEVQIKINKLEKEQQRFEKELYDFNDRFQETRRSTFRTFAALVVKFMTTHNAMSQKVRIIISEAITALEVELKSVATVERNVIEAVGAITPLADIHASIHLNCAKNSLDDAVQEAESKILNAQQDSPASSKADRSKLLPVHKINEKERNKAERGKAKAEDLSNKFKLPESEFTTSSYSCVSVW